MTAPTLDAYATFLAARWEEIEAEEWHAADCERNTYTAGPCDCGVPDLTRADLAAKRVILTFHTGTHGCPDGGVHFDYEICPTVTMLAAPFRDHPDHPANRGA